MTHVIYVQVIEQNYVNLNYNHVELFWNVITGF